MMFIQNNQNLTPDIRQQVNSLELESLSEHCALTLTKVEDRLCMIESLALQRNQSVHGHSGSGQTARPVTCFKCGKIGHTSNRCNSTSKCGGNHPLKDCNKCDEAEKERLYREKLGPRKINPPQTNRPAQAHNVQEDTSRTQPTPSNPSTERTPNEQVNSARLINVGHPSPRGTRWAQANMANTIILNNTETTKDHNVAFAANLTDRHSTIMQDIDENAMHTLVSQDNLNDDDQRVSSILGWLFDSGASSHMTPNQQDLQYNIEPSTAVVEVANGVLIRAQRRGTVRIRLTDINDSRHTCDILVHDVLWVPGLSRRLLSVDQWMAPGGAIHFNADYTTIRVVDSDTNETHSFDVPKPFPTMLTM
jgi:hypothetical protein